jgi:NNP family nitrate/nitrite transporter-like MFS transporter
LSIRDGVTSKTNARIELRTAFTRSSFWILAFAQFIRLGCYYTFIAWLPQVFKEDYNLNVLTISGAMSLFNIAGMISNPIGGMLSDKIGEKTVMLISFSFLSIGLLGFVVIPLGDFLFLESFLLGWFINFIRSPSFTIIPRFFGLEYAGSISGFQNTFASLGALFLPLVLGAVKDVTMSYSFGWIILIALIIINTILMVIMKIPVKADILLSSD